MRIRTMVGLAVAGTAAAAVVVVGVSSAVADDEPIVRIVTEEPAADNAVLPDDVRTEQAQDREDCPEKDGAAQAPATSGTGL